jgi:uncharacterized cupredoxin-like copper-binding protein
MASVIDEAIEGVTDTTPEPVHGGVGRSVVTTLSILLVVIVALGIGILARHHAEAQVFKGSDKVQVHLSSYHVQLAQTEIKAGKIGFDVHNDASIPHEFVVFKTDLPADQLPLGKDGNVIENAPQLRDVADSRSSISPGHSRALIVDLTAGHYAVVCNLPGHYHLGMHVDLTVTAQ